MVFSMIDPKPIGAFIEYTIKPLIDDSIELLNKLESSGIKPGEILKSAWRLYIFDRLLCFVTTLSCTGLICLAVYYCLHTSR